MGGHGHIRTRMSPLTRLFDWGVRTRQGARQCVQPAALARELALLLGLSYTCTLPGTHRLAGQAGLSKRPAYIETSNCIPCGYQCVIAMHVERNSKVHPDPQTIRLHPPSTQLHTAATWYPAKGSVTVNVGLGHSSSMLPCNHSVQKRHFHKTHVGSNTQATSSCIVNAHKAQALTHAAQLIFPAS